MNRLPRGASRAFGRHAAVGRAGDGFTVLCNKKPAVVFTCEQYLKTRSALRVKYFVTKLITSFGEYNILDRREIFVKPTWWQYEIGRLRSATADVVIGISTVSEFR